MMGAVINLLINSYLIIQFQNASLSIVTFNFFISEKTTLFAFVGENCANQNVT